MSRTTMLLLLLGSASLAGCGPPSGPSTDAPSATASDPVIEDDSGPLPTDLNPRRIETH